MKITKKITTVETVDLEVSLPYFTKRQDRYYVAVITESDAIHVDLVEFATLPPSYRIKFQPFSQSDLGEPITQAEFEAAYVKANDYLSEQFESMRDVKSGTTVEDVLKNMDA